MRTGGQQQLDALCLATISEKDPAKLTSLMKELNDFMEQRDQKLAESANKPFDPGF